MSDYLTIFSIRSQLDPARQPGVKDRLALMRERLEGQTPYDRTSTVKRLLMSFGFFSSGAWGQPAITPADSYLYRLSGLSALQFHTQWKRDRELPHALALGELEEISRSHSERWFPLSDVADGSLTSERGFTWWSSAQIREESIICDLHGRGMPNDWVRPHSVLLRCATAKLKGVTIAYAPSAVNGFDSVIFDAIDESSGADRGSAISIEDHPRLQTGTDEYVLGPMPVDLIEVVPLYIGDSSRKHKIYELDVHQALNDYYTAGLLSWIETHT